MLKSEYTVQDGKIIDANDSNDQGVLIPVSGEKPSSGYLNYSNNVLTSGCLVIGDYQVTFNGNEASTEKGECSSGSSITQYGYKSYDTTKNEETEIIIGINGYDVTGKNAYLKYDLTNGEVLEDTVPEACIYSNTYGGEFCLKNNEFETSAKKIKNHFGYSSNTWIQDTNDDTIWYSDLSRNITCNVRTEFVECYGSDEVSIAANVNGHVMTYIYSMQLGCDVYDNDDACGVW